MVVLASRSQGELQQLKEKITANGGQAIAVGADARTGRGRAADGAGNSGTVCEIRYLS
jgi:hypothetical protein